VQGLLPVYPVPYTYPLVDSIKAVLNRVRHYYESTSDQKIVDLKTGKVITNFSKPNKNATVSEGFAGEWSYTSGVVLSALDYIDDVIDDPRFFANNTRFFDLVVNLVLFYKELQNLR